MKTEAYQQKWTENKNEIEWKSDQEIEKQGGKSWYFLTVLLFFKVTSFFSAVSLSARKKRRREKRKESSVQFNLLPGWKPSCE